MGEGRIFFEYAVSLDQEHQEDKEEYANKMKACLEWSSGSNPYGRRYSHFETKITLVTQHLISPPWIERSFARIFHRIADGIRRKLPHNLKAFGKLLTSLAHLAFALTLSFLITTLVNMLLFMQIEYSAVVFALVSEGILRAMK